MNTAFRVEVSTAAGADARRSVRRHGIPLSMLPTLLTKFEMGSPGIHGGPRFASIEVCWHTQPARTAQLAVVPTHGSTGRRSMMTRF